MKVEVTTPAGYRYGRTASGRPLQVDPKGAATPMNERDYAEALAVLDQNRFWDLELQARERAEDEAVAKFKMKRDEATASPYRSTAVVCKNTVPTPSRDLPHGTYTLVKPDGSHRTIQIGVANWTDDKAVVASYLAGPDNELSFKAFAFVKPGGKFNLFKRYRDDSELVKDLNTLLRDADVKDAHEQFLADAEAYALRSGNCMRCGRKLTVPTSLHRGLGPVCASVEGL